MQYELVQYVIFYYFHDYETPKIMNNVFGEN